MPGSYEDMQVLSWEKLRMHPENAELDIHYNSNANDYKWGSNLGR